MKKILKNIAVTFLVLLLACSMLPAVSTEAASSYTGTYTKVWYTDSSNYIQPCYSVIINKIKKNKIRFQVEKVGRNGSPIYQTKIITAKLKNNKASFTWEDSWLNEGTGVLKLKNGYVKIKMVQTKTAYWNRSSLSTDGFLKIKKKNNKKKVYEW